MLKKFLRLLKYKLLIPILRSHAPAIETARGVSVGLISAMTPLVGIQMALVGVVWALQRAIAPNWKFNIVAAMAWTWVTNVFTVPIVYYIFLITGRLILGRWEKVLGFDEFSEKLEEILSIGGGGITAIWAITLAMIELWGVPLFIGCIPWAVFCGWGGYHWTLKYKDARERRLRSVIKTKSR